LKIYVFTRFKFFCLVLVGAFFFWYFSHPVLLVNTARQVNAYLTGRIIPIYSVERPDQALSITFDATWGADQTGNLLEILRKNRVKATFFLCGLWVEKYPEMVKRIALEGHEIGNHSYTHPHMNKLTSEEIAHEILQTHQLIRELTDQTPTVFRPPFGEYNNRLIETARSCHYETIIWDVDSLDWKNLSASEMLNRIIKRVQPGSIILCHNAGKHTPETVSQLLPFLKKQGYQLVPLSQLLLKGETYTDHTGRQKLKKTAPIIKDFPGEIRLTGKQVIYGKWVED